MRIETGELPNGSPAWEDSQFLSPERLSMVTKLHTCITCRRGYTKAHMALDGVHCQMCAQAAA